MIISPYVTNNEPKITIICCKDILIIPLCIENVLKKYKHGSEKEKTGIILSKQWKKVQDRYDDLFKTISSKTLIHHQ